MAMATPGGVSMRLQTLFDSGSVGDLPDGVLLERFLSSRDEAVFEALVTPHGPMVLRVCHAALGDMDKAEDAFQATFLVLVRRAGSIRSRGSIASWLYGVVSRVSARARVASGRRGRHERASAAGRPSVVPTAAFEPDDREDPVPLLYDELARHGDMPGALKTAASIPESGRGGEAYCEIAAIQAREHEAEPALQWATRLEPPRPMP